MLKTTVNIGRYAVRIGVTHKGPHKHDKILPAIKELASVRVGSKISRLARLLTFNGRKFQKVLGGSLAFLIILTNMFPPIDAASAAPGEAEVVAIQAATAPIETNVLRRIPVDGRLSITQGYHAFHAGVDIDGVTGDPIYPYTSGKIEYAGRDFFLGNMGKVKHADGYESVYAHLDKISVKAGQDITTAEKLGTMGNTGRSFGDHLHLEVYKDGRHVNPTSVMPIR